MIELNPSLHNPVTGDRLTILRSPLSGEGEMLVFRCVMPPRGDGAPLHVHDQMLETFEVEQGALAMVLANGRHHRLEAGESISIAPGTPHSFRNPTDGETVFVTTATPGEDLETFLRAMYALANAGHPDHRVQPS